MERENGLLYRVTIDGVIYFAGRANSKNAPMPICGTEGVALGRVVHRDMAGAVYAAVAEAFSKRLPVRVTYTLAPQIDHLQTSRQARILPVSQRDGIAFIRVID